MIEILRATVEDAPKILEIKLRAFSDEFKFYGPGAIPPQFDSLERQKDSIAKLPYFFKIVSDAAIVGAVVVVDKGEGVFILASIHIDLDKQNQGIGTAVLKMIERQFPRAKKWQLETPYRSYRNHHFYEKFGYVKVGEHVPPHAQGTSFMLFDYEKLIKE